MKKDVLVTNGNNDHLGNTIATTEAGYIRAAKRIWPYAGLSRVRIKVYDPKAEKLGHDPVVFETVIDIY